MKVHKLVCLVFLFVGLVSHVYAMPPSEIGGPESIGLSICPTPPPNVCPTPVACRRCPSCPSECPTAPACPTAPSCPAPSACEVCPTPIVVVSIPPSVPPSIPPSVPPSIPPSVPPSIPPSLPPTVEACQGYYQFDFSHGKVRGKKSDLRISQTGSATELSCFEEIVNSIISDRNLGLGSLATYTAGENYVQNNKGEKVSAFFTQHLWDALLARSGTSRDNYQANKSLINCTGGYRNLIPSEDNGFRQIGGGTRSREGKKGCVSGQLYLTPDCSLAEVSDVRGGLEQCGSMSLYSEISTPISLVWSEKYKDIPSTIVNFKLDPYSDNESWMWRGSEALPLLVYDPEHTGVISSATQLFGSWTFGGNGLASLVEGHTRGTPWRDGYEALSKLDRDLDGKVSGEELKDIALWFDKNKDGISQEGEVKTLLEVDVTALFYNSDKKEDGALVASMGYEREVDGKTVIASSIDWMEKGLKDGFDVMLENLHAKSAVLSTKVGSSEKTSDHAKAVAPEIYGVWGWSLDAPASGSGYFAFDPTDQGVMGLTVSQIGIRGKSTVDSQLMFSHFLGEGSKSDSGLAQVSFEVVGENGQILKNTATLSEDGSELVGKTTVIGSTLSESGSYEYAWRASRLR